MPMNRALYPADWEQIATEVKDAANWHCENCDRPCRRPGQRWIEFANQLLELGYSDHSKPQQFTLTVAHLDHQPANCDRANLRALCSGCHLRYDAAHHAASRRRQEVS